MDQQQALEAFVRELYERIGGDVSRIVTSQPVGDQSLIDLGRRLMATPAQFLKGTAQQPPAGPRQDPMEG